MKKYVILLIAIAVLFSFAGCEESHEHAYNMEITKQETCTEDGLRTFSCACGSSYTEVINATGHAWGSWTTESYALVGKPGIERKTCQNCSSSEERERTDNEIYNSFYDSGLQYIIATDGLMNGYSLLNYARHEFHDYMYKVTPTATILAQLAKHFQLTDAMKADIIAAAIEDEKMVQQYGGEGNYGYNSAEDTFTLTYNAESMNFRLLGYVCDADNNYTIYCASSEFSYEDMPEKIWRVQLEYNKINGQPNRYLSVNEVFGVPDNLVAYSVGETGG